MNPVLEAKLAKAKEYLGKKWVLHPANRVYAKRRYVPS